MLDIHCAFLKLPEVVIINCIVAWQPVWATCPIFITNIEFEQLLSAQLSVPTSGGLHAIV